MFDGLISVYRNAIDVFFYVIGSAKENELILAHVLSTFMEALALLFRSVLPADGRVRTMLWRLNVPARPPVRRMLQEPSREAHHPGKL